MTPMKAIRANCLDCCGGSSKSVKFCPCDGVNSTACPLWMLRFGHGTTWVTEHHGPEYVTPGSLPNAGVPLEVCGGGNRNDEGYARAL